MGCSSNVQRRLPRPRQHFAFKTRYTQSRKCWLLSAQHICTSQHMRGTALLYAHHHTEATKTCYVNCAAAFCTACHSSTLAWRMRGVAMPSCQVASPHIDLLPVHKQTGWYTAYSPCYAAAWSSPLCPDQTEEHWPGHRPPPPASWQPGQSLQQPEATPSAHFAALVPQSTVAPLPATYIR